MLVFILTIPDQSLPFSFLCLIYVFKYSKIDALNGHFVSLLFNSLINLLHEFSIINYGVTTLPLRMKELCIEQESVPAEYLIIHLMLKPVPLHKSINVFKVRHIKVWQNGASCGVTHLKR